MSNARNTQLVAAMLIYKSESLVPGMRALYATMRTRCGKHTPYGAWSFSFHSSFNIVPDYAPFFVVRTSRRWYVF